MKLLTKQALDRAVDFLKHDARPLEQARYAYHFEGGSAADVLAALSAFQNRDGGFGHGLEADIRLPDSSVIATTVAFQIFREVGKPGDNPLLADACRYLNDTYDPARGKWPIIPASIDDAPHAPWWVFGGDLDESNANPRAEIAGYLNDYPGHFPAALREQVTNSVFETLLAQPDQIVMFDLFCYIRFQETDSLPAQMRATALDKLRRIVPNVVERNPDNWKAYRLPPLHVAHTPSSPFRDLFGEAIDLNLDFLIDIQGDNGAWTPPWSWGDIWPDAWAQAARDWSGVLTLENLRILRAYGRIE